MGRLLRYRGAEPATITDGDGSVLEVQPDSVIEIDPRVARDLLRQPGVSEDDGTHPWVPEPRPVE